MTYRFLHITITPLLIPVNQEKIQTRLSDLGRDWMSYNTLSWILWTNKSILTVTEMLIGDIDEDDQLLVVALNPAEIPNGRLPNWMWDWFNRPRNSQTGDVQTPLLSAPDAQNIFDPDIYGSLPLGSGPHF